MKFKAQPAKLVEVARVPAPDPNSPTIVEAADVTRYVGNFGKQGVAAWRFDPPLVIPAGARAVVNSVRGTITVEAGRRSSCHQAEKAEPTW